MYPWLILSKQLKWNLYNEKNDYIRYLGQIITVFMKENRQNFVENRQKMNEKIFVFKIPVNILYWKKIQDYVISPWQIEITYQL